SRKLDSRGVLQTVGEHARQHVLRALRRMPRHLQVERLVDAAVDVGELNVEAIDGCGEGHFWSAVGVSHRFQSGGFRFAPPKRPAKITPARIARRVNSVTD